MTVSATGVPLQLGSWLLALDALPTHMYCCAVGGLEVFHRPTQTWHPVQPVENAFVVNIGDMMERWSNELYTSTLHRVISPVSERNRYSVAFFNEGRLDQIIECIPTCLKPGDKPKFEPVQVEAHLRARYGGSY